MATVEIDDFQQQLIAQIPVMRAFARTLSDSTYLAEDLAQDGLVRALTCRHQFTPGTNLRAWLLTIIRNLFYSSKRRSWRSTSLEPEVAEQTIVADEDASASVELDELRRAMTLLPDEQREALILVGAAGLSYEEAAEICAAPVGTIKSRVSRARDRLALIYAEGGIPHDDAIGGMAAMLAQIDSLCGRKRA
ncbi:MAG TPA: sigma-70 family RNA polymerase sigma factor [Caulobacteraceae bacterium]|jgi:RNA polymerase sigma-70 factor (ECF subfamily)